MHLLPGTPCGAPPPTGWSFFQPAPHTNPAISDIREIQRYIQLVNLFNELNIN